MTEPIPRPRPRPRRRRKRTGRVFALVVAGLLVLVFALGVALGEALHDNPLPSEVQQTNTRTLLPQEPVTVTVTVPAS